MQKPANWREDLRRRGQAAREQLQYRADHPQEATQRPIFTYIPSKEEIAQQHIKQVAHEQKLDAGIGPSILQTGQNIRDFANPPAPPALYTPPAPATSSSSQQNAGSTKSKGKKKSLINKVGNVAKDVWGGVNRLSQAIDRQLIPNTPMFDPEYGKPGHDSKFLPGPTSRDIYTKDYNATSGNKTVDKVLDVAGQGLSFVAPVTGMPGAGAMDLYQTPGIERIAQGAGRLATGRTASALLGRVNQGLNSRGLSISPSLVNRAAQEATREAVIGAPLMMQNEALQGHTTLQDQAQAALSGAALGGVTGAAMPVLGAAARSVLRRNAIREQPAQELLHADAVPQGQRIDVTPSQAPEATPITPVKQNWIERLFGPQKIGITAMGSSKSNRMVSTEQQLVSNPLRKTVGSTLDSAKQAAKSSYQNTVDFLSPLKAINRETYNTAMDASRANNLANTIIHDKFVDNEGNVIGHSLNDVMKTVRGLGKKFDDYLVLRHAVTRMSRGERVYDEALQMTPEKATAAVARLEAQYPQLKQAGAMWDQFNTNMLDSGVREGLISQEARDAMRQANPNYASMRRQFTVGEKLAQPKWGNGGSAFSGQKAPIKEVSPTGSTRKIVSPIRSAIEQSYAWKNAELRNRTMQQIVQAIQHDPEGMKGIAEIVKKPSTSYKSLDQALREGGSEEFLQQLDSDFKSLFRMHQSGDENVVRAMINGTPVFVKVHNPEAVKALLGLGSEQSGFILKAIQKLSNATKRGATGLLAPMFSVKNLTADTVQAAIQSPNAVKHVLVDLPHALISSLADTLHIPGLRNLAEDFRRAGGEYSALLRGDRALNASMMNLRKEAPLSMRGLAKGSVLAVKAPFKALEKVADVTENVNRMAAYRRAMARQERTPEAVRNAINAARESTVNFSRRGALGRETEAIFPYSNAAIQGLYRIAKAFVRHPLKTVAGVGALVVAPKLYEYAQFNDDPDYQKLPARERYRNIIISKNADGTFNKQPMPPEYLAFGAFIQDVLNDVVNKDPQAYKGTLDAVVNAFTPSFISGPLQGVTQGGGAEQGFKGAFNATVFAPAVAVAGNQSFTGAPIVPKRLEGNSTQYQYDERTSTVAKEVGKRIGLAPLKVDYLLRAYGGDPSRLILPLMSDVGAGTPRNTLLKNFIVDPVFTNTLSNDYYAAKDAFTKAKNDHADYGTPLPPWYSDQAYAIINSQRRGSASKRLTTLNAEKRSINGDRSLSAKEKAQKLRDVQSEINNIYADVNSQLAAKGFKFPNR